MDVISQQIMLSDGTKARIKNIDKEKGSIKILLGETEKEYYLPVAFSKGIIIPITSETQALFVEIFNYHRNKFDVKIIETYRNREEKNNRLFDNYLKNRFKFNKYELWEAYKNFQSNWDLEAGNFLDMLKKSMRFAKFIENNWWQPICGLVAVTEVVPEEVRSLFRELFAYDGDGRSSIQERVEKFLTGMEKFSKMQFGYKEKYYQDVQTVSLYLLLFDPHNNYWYMDWISSHEDGSDVRIDQLLIDFKQYYNFCDNVLNSINKSLNMMDYLRNEQVAFNNTQEDYHILVSDILRNCSIEHKYRG